MINQRGFTLIEIAIVLIIATIILGYTMAMVPVQQELKQYREADAEMNQIIDSVYAFAQVNGYLPCPALAASNGFECRNNNGTAADCDGDDPQTHSCDTWFGFVPAKTLGISGNYSDDGLLLDSWGEPYQYQVTDSDDEDTDGDGDRDGDGTPDMILQGGIQVTTNSTFVVDPTANPMNLSLLSPDLVICNTDPSAGAVGAADTRCVDAPETVFGSPLTTNPCTDPTVHCSPLVILSTGKDAGNVASFVQQENLDNSLTDRVFIKTTRSNVAGAEFDDLVKWISPNILYSKMIEGGQLP